MEQVTERQMFSWLTDKQAEKHRRNTEIVSMFTRLRKEQPSASTARVIEACAYEFGITGNAVRYILKKYEADNVGSL